MSSQVKLTFIKSSNLFKVGYDPKTKTLHIIFVKRKQQKYLFTEVSSPRYKALMNSESKGEYFDKNIKGRYNFSIVPA